MKEGPARSLQLLLTVPAIALDEMNPETERQLVAALADLLLDAAVHGAVAKEGASDEREDSR